MLDSNEEVPGREQDIAKPGRQVNANGDRGVLSHGAPGTRMATLGAWFSFLLHVSQSQSRGRLREDHVLGEAINGEVAVVLLDLDPDCLPAEILCGA